MWFSLPDYVICSIGVCCCCCCGGGGGGGCNWIEVFDPTGTTDWFSFELSALTISLDGDGAAVVVVVVVVAAVVVVVGFTKQTSTRKWMYSVVKLKFT